MKNANTLFISLVTIIAVIFTGLNIFNYYHNNSTNEPANANIVMWGSPKLFKFPNNNKLENVNISQAIKINISDFSSIKTGYNFWGYIDANKDLQLIGDNRSGQIGNNYGGTYVNSFTKSNIGNVENFALGHSHTLAVNDQGEVFSWGQNLSGQLGTGDNVDQQKPTKINGLESVEKVFAFDRASFAINKNGQVYAFGGSCDTSGINAWSEAASKINVSAGYYDREGATIDEKTNSNDCNPASEVNMNINSKSPKLVGALANIQDISGGYGHFVFLDTTGNIFTYGCNLYGQLGRNGNINDVVSQQPTQLALDFKVQKISAGFRHTLLLDENGSVYSFGHNEYGELGQGDKVDRYTPTKINNIPKIRDIIASVDYSILIDYDNNAYMFGKNEFLQIYNDSNIKEVLLPIKIENYKFKNIYSDGTFIIGETI